MAKVTFLLFEQYLGVGLTIFITIVFSGLESICFSDSCVLTIF